MSVPLINALRAAETLAAFHRQQAAHKGDEYDIEMAERCEKDAALIQDMLLDYDITPEHEADAMRERDRETAYALIDRHLIMRGIAIEDVPAAREAIARDIANALEAARGGGGFDHS